MAKVIIQGNHVFMRHWLKWYKLQGRHAHRIIFKRESRAMKNKMETVYNPKELEK